MKNRRIHKMEKEIIVAMKDGDFAKAIAIDNEIKQIRDGGCMER